MLLKYVCGCHVIRLIVIKRITMLVLSIRWLGSRNERSKNSLCSILRKYCSRKNNEHVACYKSRKSSITIRDRNSIVESTHFWRREIFFKFNQENARGAWQKYDSNERDFLVSSISCVTSRMLLVLCASVGKKRKKMCIAKRETKKETTGVRYLQQAT